MKWAFFVFFVSIAVQAGDHAPVASAPARAEGAPASVRRLFPADARLKMRVESVSISERSARRSNFMSDFLLSQSTPYGYLFTKFYFSADCTDRRGKPRAVKALLATSKNYKVEPSFSIQRYSYKSGDDEPKLALGGEALNRELKKVYDEQASIERAGGKCQPAQLRSELFVLNRVFASSLVGGKDLGPVSALVEHAWRRENFEKRVAGSISGKESSSASVSASLR